MKFLPKALQFLARKLMNSEMKTQVQFANFYLLCCVIGYCIT